MQGNKPRKKKDPWDPLKHLDDNRTKWEKGLTGLGEALSADQEEESTLSSIATIVDAAATIKRTFDNNKKLGEETKDVKIEDVTKDFSAYQDLDPFVDFSNRTDDASQNFFKQVQNLNPEDPKHRLIAKIVGTSKLNSRGSQHETTQNKFITEIQKSQTPEDTLPDIEDDINPQDPDWKTPNQAWLDDTANSPAAQAGLSDALRLQAKERHDQFKADRQKPEEITEKIKNTDDIINKGDSITDSVKDIDGQIGDFVDPDKLKFKSLLGNFIGRNA
jgi:hypothetical protein